MSNVSSDASETKLLPRVEGIAFCISYFLESVAIIVANTIAIIIFTSDRKLKQSKFYLLINLAVADLLVGIACGPVWIYNLAFSFDLWPAPDHVALIWKRSVPETIEMFVKYASLISLTMIAAERVFATFKPTKYRSLSRTTHYMLIVVCWVLAILMPLNYMVSVQELIEMWMGLYIMLAFTCVLLLITCVCYIAIWIKIKFGQQGVTTAQETKLTVSLFLVTVASLATWLPCQTIFSVFMVGMIRGEEWFSMNTYNRVLNSTALLLLANSLVNPIIYAFRIPHFKHHAAQLFTRRSRRGAYREELQLEESPVTVSNPNNTLLVPRATAETSILSMRKSSSSTDCIMLEKK